jgi:uncharacterized protein (DUF3084 family)
MKKQRGGDPDIDALAQEAVQIISEGVTHSLVNVKPQITAGFNLIYKKGKKEGEEASLQEIAKLNSAVSGLNGEKEQLAADKEKSVAEKEQLAAANKNLTAVNKRLNTEYMDLFKKFEQRTEAEKATLSTAAVSAASTAKRVAAQAAAQAAARASNFFGSKLPQQQNP